MFYLRKEILLLLDGRLERPLPPVLVHSNHYSIELQWENVRIQDNNRPEHRRLFDESGAPRPGSLIYLHRREKKSGSIWESIYSGSAMSYKVENLKPNIQYEFRIQCKSSVNGGERSDWSPILQAGTTPEPMTGDTVYKAIAMPGKDHLEKLLEILGPEHYLLEHPDKDGNLPLMHACLKLDLGKVESLITAGAKVNNTIASRKTALMVAASAGFSKACTLLIENGANVYSRDQNDISILHHAIDSKNFETVSTIVRQFNQDKDIEMNREVGIHKWTPLYRAIVHDCNKEIIELLLNHGANAQCEDKTTNTTALQMAIIRGNLITTQLLVTHGADTRSLSKTAGKSLQQLALSTHKTDLINYVNSLLNLPKS
ncbi:unnamed protein product [Adineta steineri]|uniref:Fibronectin type-III domain-containing protein n=1 Tax=Adineta steineri TaxID=433720 RepID=A0A815L3B9_9BILA|nr:unnamed protein product [Adineta steineri]